MLEAPTYPEASKEIFDFFREFISFLFLCCCSIYEREIVCILQLLSLSY